MDLMQKVGDHVRKKTNITINVECMFHGKIPGDICRHTHAYMSVQSRVTVLHDNDLVRR
jgi:hypothetical protein